MAKEIVLENGKSVKKPFNPFWIWFFVILILLFISFLFINVDVSGLHKTLGSAGKFFTKLFAFDAKTFTAMPIILKALALTIAMAVAGSIFGMICAFPVCIYCANNINNNWLVWLIRSVLNVLRTIPILVVAMIFKFIFGATAFTGFFAVFITTFLIGIKMMYEYIETLNLSVYHSALSIGMTKFQAIISTVVPQINGYFVSTTLYMIETNIRMATILGVAGVGGIGFLLQDKLYQAPDVAGLIIVVLFVVVIGIEYINKILRKRLA